MSETINVKVRKNVASATQNLFIVAENTDYRIVFDFDSPSWEAHEYKTCRISTGNEYVDVDFTGSAVDVPAIPSTVGNIYVGVYAGELQTTTPARIPVHTSILGLGDEEYDPVLPDVKPAATAVALNDLLQMTDVSEGKIVKATIQQITEAISGGMKGIYWAEYGETTFEELRTAIEADLLPALRLSGEIYIAANSNMTQVDFCSIPRPGSLTLVKHSINSRNAWARSEIDLAEEGKDTIFPVQYETTLHSLILAAKAGGRLPVLTYNDQIYILNSCDSSSAVFVTIAGDLSEIETVSVTSANEWSTRSANLDDIVRVSIQNLTAAQKTQARANIEAAKAADAAGNAYRAASFPKGKVASTSTATAFTASVEGITELRDGVCVWLENGVVTSAAGCTLDINGLGAKPIYSSQAIASAITTAFNKNYTELFVYNATRVSDGCWDMVYGYDSDTTYTPASLGSGYAECTTETSTLAKVATINSYKLTTGGIVAIKFTNNVPAGATLNITAKGAKAIYYKGAPITADVIKAGDTVTMIYSTYYHILSIDRDEAPVHSVNGQTGNVTLSASDVGAEPEIDVVTIATNGAVTQALDAGKFYKFTGALISLTITLNPTTRAHAQYHFTFVSGATAVTLSIPGTIRMPDGFSVEANKTYEMDFLDGLGLCACWTDTSS